MDTSNAKDEWTLKEAKARLPQILRLSEVDAPQTGGAKTFVVTPAESLRENGRVRKARQSPVFR